MLPATVDRAVTGYLRLADRLLPGRVAGLYVVGSTALGAYVDGRSDIDLVAVVDGEPDVAAVRTLTRRSAAAGAVDALRHRRTPVSGTCNAVFVRAADLTRPASEITPIGSGIAGRVRAETGISPVDWTVLAQQGIPVRGPHPGELGLDPEPERLRAWNRANLESYWRPWAAHHRRASVTTRLRPGYLTTWAVLGPPRLHHTIATGGIVSKEAAGEYALDVLPARWHPLIGYALAYRRREPRPAPPPHDLVADFVDHVVDDAHALA